MRLVIPRGIIYHRFFDDLKWFFLSLFARLDDEKKVSEFESVFSKLLGSKHCLAFPFARTAIYYALKAKGFPKGGEVIMPPISIKGILDAVIDLGLTPVFVDIDPDTLCFDLELLEKSMNSNTKAVVVTYLFGMVPDVARMGMLCKAKKVFMIEDFSQCLNGMYKGKKVGSFGDVGVYSSSSIKTLDTYGGGLLVTDDSVLAEQLVKDKESLGKSSRVILIKKIIVNLIRNFATRRIPFHFLTFPFIRVVNSLYKGSVMKHTGGRAVEMIPSLPEEWFFSYTSIQASVGLEQISCLEVSDDKRIENVGAIKGMTESISFPKGIEYSKNIYWQLVAYFEDPVFVQDYLHKNKIDTSTTSLEYLSDLSNYPYKGVTPNADRLYSKALFIPAFPGLSRADIMHISNTLNALKVSGIDEVSS